MNELIRDVLRNIHERFPLGFAASRIEAILNDTAPFDYIEMNGYLEDIMTRGSWYNGNLLAEDRRDAEFFITKLREACVKTDKF
jgi:hypothetical protein